MFLLSEKETEIQPTAHGLVMESLGPQPRPHVAQNSVRVLDLSGTEIFKRISSKHFVSVREQVDARTVNRLRIRLRQNQKSILTIDQECAPQIPNGGRLGSILVVLIAYYDLALARCS
jgi:hypothetical protein